MNTTKTSNSVNEEEILDDIFHEFRLKELKKFSIQGKTQRELSECLPRLKKEALEYCAVQLGIPHDSIMKKADLARIIVEHLQNPVEIESMISWASDEQQNFLKHLLSCVECTYETKSMLDIFWKNKYLISSGLIHVFEKKNTYELVLSREIQEALEKLNWTKVIKTSTKNRQIEQYCTSAITLYGAISLEKLYEIYCHYQDGQDVIKKEEFIQGVYDSEIKVQNYWTDETNIYSEYFEPSDLEKNLLKEILGNHKPYYLPDKIEFIKYADIHYESPNPEFDLLMAFLRKFGKMSENKWDDLGSNILYNIEFGNLMDVFNELENAKIQFNSQNDLDQFAKLYMSAVNNQRIWVNHGYTPNELHNMPKQKKVGRNEPCPCGSGKKYKKCCGTN